MLFLDFWMYSPVTWKSTFDIAKAIFEDNHIDDTSMAADVHLDLDVLLPRKGVLSMTGKFCKIGLDMLSRPAFISKCMINFSSPFNQSLCISFRVRTVLERSCAGGGPIMFKDGEGEWEWDGC